MKRYKLKQIVGLNTLSKPYIKGNISGIIIGVGIAKILNNVYMKYNMGILTGFIILIIGIIFWYIQYERDKLN